MNRIVNWKVLWPRHIIHKTFFSRQQWNKNSSTTELLKFLETYLSRIPPSYPRDLNLLYLTLVYLIFPSLAYFDLPYVTLTEQNESRLIWLTFIGLWVVVVCRRGSKLINLASALPVIAHVRCTADNLHAIVQYDLRPCRYPWTDLDTSGACALVVFR